MMDSFEFSKIAGAVFAALLLIFAPKAAIDIWQGGHHEIKSGFVLPAPSEQAAAPEGGTGGPAAAFDPDAVVKSIASANVEAGHEAFRRCLTCHSAEKDAASKASAPNLWEIVGRQKAGRADFGGYSEPMKAKGGEWTYTDLASFLHSPKGYLPGTKMLFAGIPDPNDLADVVAYLRTLADNPAPLPN